MVQNNIKLDNYALSILIDAFFKHGRTIEAQKLFSRMLDTSHDKLNVVAYSALIDGYFKGNDVNKARELFDDMRKRGLSPNVRSYSIMINGYCKNKLIDKAVTLFEEMHSKGLCKEGLFDEALTLLSKMEGDGYLPDYVSYETIVHALLDKNHNETAEKLLHEMKSRGLLKEDNKKELSLELQICRSNPSSLPRLATFHLASNSIIHWPVSMKKGTVGIKPEYLTIPNIPDIWRAMEALYDSGKARAIGVCNFSSKKLQDILDIARVPPAVNQVELHLQWQKPKLHEFCKSKGIHISGYSPLGSLLHKDYLLNNPAINLVAEKLGKTPAQVALRWERLIDDNGFFVHETYGAYRTPAELWDGG
ncbi:hypothetical protein PIB30_022111 [Stylosanthes scabra]|uniref:NADP-dependent oxidoreductase domain-containing protein n=1 Tax=Stylosanthes scabra TaxID=79078 RepID=A0ABU6S9L7_9FABA|nr:hypothetical protein [Stylosanthes scabra]